MWRSNNMTLLKITRSLCILLARKSLTRRRGRKHVANSISSRIQPQGSIRRLRRKSRTVRWDSIWPAIHRRWCIVLYLNRPGQDRLLNARQVAENWAFQNAGCETLLLDDLRISERLEQDYSFDHACDC